jgi:hypothetical protein
MVNVFKEFLLIAAVVLLQPTLGTVKYGAGVVALIWVGLQVPTDLSWLVYSIIIIASIGFGGLILTDKALNNMADGLLMKAIEKGVI